MRRDDTRAEKRAWVLLRDRRMFGLKFRRQVPIGDYIVDFLCPELRLVIELDGEIHDDPRQSRIDRVKDSFLTASGYRVLRVPNGVILKFEEDFTELIRRLVMEG
ncbi:MAG TPA: endonuclease domain-containing protein [Terriglobia bacterium]|nr:endonuclease domain-containing protein [Terriglobia bacterium]